MYHSNKTFSGVLRGAGGGGVACLKFHKLVIF